MGLDAGVYKNLRDVPEELRKQVRLDDAVTGEINYVDDLWQPGHTRKDLFAIDIRIGNVWTVADLRYEVETRMPGKSVIMNAVIYSGSHAGDFVPFDQLDKLEEEVKFLKAYPEPLPSNLQEFLNEMTMLIDAARREQNPIVF